MMCNPAELHHVSGVEYWKLTSDNSEPAVTLYWKDANRSQITNLADLCVAHYEDCDGPGPGTNVKWAYKGGDPNAVGTLGVGGSGYVTSTIPFSSYSPITFGTRTSSNPLPISLLSFNAVCENNKVDITWSTATETNNDFFTIQRSVDASDWEFVKSIPGGGNSNSTLYYSATDTDPLNGTSYYRLKQTDYNGQSEVFSPVSVICGEEKAGQSISYYPNPFTSEVVVDLHNIMYKNAMIKIYDLLGKEVYRMNLNSYESETQKLIMDLHSLSGGIYSVEFISDDFSNTSKIVKNY
ncbi:MAG TPA: T9SS type A sorting domain-containing protein [Bacteroidales bacterium]|nr:T9SS type A sorting domain-containing protein [Bacteroidales bacterium]